MSTLLFCCEPGCGRPAEFLVYDESSCVCDHYQRETHACSAHVGELIGHSGEPVAKHEKWGVYPLRSSLGNTEPGDGPRYKGRGWIQITGRANYRAAGEALSLPLEDEPQRASDPMVAWRVAAWFWRTRGLSDVDSLEKVTRRINGGTNGLADRRARYAVACAALGVTT